MLERAEQQVSGGAAPTGAKRPTRRSPMARRWSGCGNGSGSPTRTEFAQQPRRIVRPMAQAPAAEPRKNRWWQRWFRDAA